MNIDQEMQQPPQLALSSLAKGKGKAVDRQEDENLPWWATIDSQLIDAYSLEDNAGLRNIVR